MEKRKLWTGIGAAFGMLVLILDGKTALEGARQGIELCLRTVIPSLFPFFLLSILLTSSFMGSSLPILRPLGRLCRVPIGAESLLVSGLLGGYPVGAQAIAEAYRAGQLQKTDAERLLAFCNNAGPAFLFGMVSSMFPRKWIAWALWGTHIAGAVLAALLIPGDGAKSVTLSESRSVTLSASLNSALKVMAAVCGWVILFRVILAFLSRWFLWLLPAAAQVAVTGVLELSNGCCELLAVTDVRMRFCICAGMLSFGGLCVTMQTVSVTGELSLRHYFLGKGIQTTFSLALAAALVYGAWLPVGVLFLLSLLFRQKKSSNPAVVGV